MQSRNLKTYLLFWLSLSVYEIVGEDYTPTGFEQLFQPVNGSTPEDVYNSSTTIVPEDNPSIQSAFILIPLILVVGLFGNIMAVIVMVNAEFNKTMTRFILISLALSDTVVLLMSPLNRPFMWKLMRIDIRSLSDVSCKIYFWFFRTAKFTSAWFIVLVSLERFVAIWFPLKIKVLITKRVILLGICAVYVGIGIFDTTVSNYTDMVLGGRCTPYKTYPKWTNLARYIVISAASMYSLIPCLLILALNIASVARLLFLAKRRSKMTTNRNDVQQQKLTALLLGTSCMFLVLSLPIAILYCLSVFTGFDVFHSESRNVQIFSEVAQTMELLNYAVNFYLYVLCSGQFRRVVCRLLMCGWLIKRRHSSLNKSVSTDMDTTESRL